MKTLENLKCLIFNVDKKVVKGAICEIGPDF